MDTISQIRERSRRSLHEFMGRPVAYYPDPDVSTFYEVKAREHSGIAQAGDLAGTNLSYSEVHDRKEYLRFWKDGLPPLVRNSLVVFNETKGFWIDNVLPDDGLTVDAEVIRADQSSLVGKTTVDGSVIGA